MHTAAVGLPAGRNYTDESSMPGQPYWVDEEVRAESVVRLLEAARQLRAGCVGRYAGILRYWYGVASGNGEDVDGGIGLEYLRAIHFSQQGRKGLWEQTVEAAKKVDVSRRIVCLRFRPLSINSGLLPVSGESSCLRKSSSLCRDCSSLWLPGRNVFCG